jgi:hypothetical protein
MFLCIFSIFQDQNYEKLIFWPFIDKMLVLDTLWCSERGLIPGFVLFKTLLHIKFQEYVLLYLISMINILVGMNKYVQNLANICFFETRNNQKILFLLIYRVPPSPKKERAHYKGVFFRI